AAAVVTGAGFLWFAWVLFRTTETVAMKKAGRALFTYSLSYLAVIFLALITDHVANMLGWL
ncbi:MAG: protoheme IX farnesyltransferase, partial [Devosia sp.]|nr:protoheme IX farnesyltransferase [Devosia sp.]